MSFLFSVQGSCDVLRLVDLHQSPNYNKIISYRSESTELYLTGNATPEPVAASVPKAPRAQSAPHDKNKRKVDIPQDRPESSLGLLHPNDAAMPASPAGNKENNQLTKEKSEEKM